VGEYRHEVPAISSRNLYDLDFAEFSFTKQVSIASILSIIQIFLKMKMKYFYKWNSIIFENGIQIYLKIKMKYFYEWN